MLVRGAMMTDSRSHTSWWPSLLTAAAVLAPSPPLCRAFFFYASHSEPAWFAFLVKHPSRFGAFLIVARPDRPRGCGALAAEEPPGAVSSQPQHLRLGRGPRAPEGDQGAARGQDRGVLRPSHELGGQERSPRHGDLAARKPSGGENKRGAVSGSERRGGGSVCVYNTSSSPGTLVSQGFGEALDVCCRYRPLTFYVFSGKKLRGQEAASDHPRRIGGCAVFFQLSSDLPFWTPVNLRLRDRLVFSARAVFFLGSIFSFDGGALRG